MELDGVQAAELALCMLLRSYLCPDESDPSPYIPLHGFFGEALLQEIRRREDVGSPSLIDLLRRVQDYMCPSGDESTPEAEYFAAVKACIGRHLGGLETPDDIVCFFASLSDEVIT